MDALLSGQPAALGSTIVTPLRKHSGALHYGVLQFRLSVLVIVYLQVMSGAFIFFASIINNYY